MAASSSDSEESLASLCKEAEQLKVKIDEEKQKFCDAQRKFHSSAEKASLKRCDPPNPSNTKAAFVSAVKTCLFQSRKWDRRYLCTGSVFSCMSSSIVYSVLNIY